MVLVPFVWIDWRVPGAGPGAFDLLAPHWPVRRALELPEPGHAPELLRLCGPEFVCIETDQPGAEGLARLAHWRRAHPDLPLLVLMDAGPAPVRVALLQLGVWECLPPTVGAVQLNASIAAFSGFCRQRHLGNLGERGDSSHIHTNGAKRPPRHKTAAALAHVSAHYAEALCLREVAQLCYLSDSEFSRCFKKENALTFSQYLVHCRLQKACELLGQQHGPIKAVAFEVGFNDVSYFARTFRRSLGVAPSDYQRRVADQAQTNCAESLGICADFSSHPGAALPKLD
jgi:AraC-like DNA-binding protein